MPTPSMSSQVAFMAVVAFVLTSGVLAVRQAAPGADRGRITAGAVVAALAWMAVTGAVPGLGLISETGVWWYVPPFLVCLLLAAVGAGLSPLGLRIAQSAPLWALVGFQAMRFPLELVLHQWTEEGVVPPQMTWTGQNIDIVAGLVCLVMAPLSSRHRAAAWAAQVVGSVLLLNVLRVAATSAPTPLQRFEEPLLVIFHLPTTWIASVCVVGAVFGHVVLQRRLLSPQDE